MLQEKLDDKLDARTIQTGRYCTLIVMHPKTWQDLFIEITNSDEFASYAALNGVPPKYRGIKVLRSLDISEGLFEVR